MLRILINAISIRTGGAKTFLRNLLPELSRQYPNWKFNVYIRKSQARFYRGIAQSVVLYEVDDRDIHTIAKRLKFEHWVIPRLLSKKNIQVHWQVDEMLSPMISSRKVISLLTYHTTPMVLLDGATGDPWIYRQYLRTIRKLAIRKVTVPITVSFHAKAELSGLYPAAHHKLQVVYHGVNHKLFSPGYSDKKILSDLGIHNSYILSISNRFIWKNYYRLIQAYHQAIRKEDMQEDLVLIGKPVSDTEEQRIQQYISTNNLDKRIHILNYIEPEYLPNIYRGATLYIFPSLQETFGLTILEAMACGVPVACSLWGPFPEIAGDAAIFFNPLSIDEMADAIQEICTDINLRRELSFMGLAHSKKFSWEKTARAYAQIIWKAVNSRLT